MILREGGAEDYRLQQGKGMLMLQTNSEGA